jgi:uncharacterized protein (DUF58 family)
MLEGGRYALLHTRSLEFDDLRPYVPGDDVRDIDWKATARSGQVLIKRFVTEKHHKILVVADAGRNTTALAPSGEPKRDVAAHVIGAMGLIALRRSDEIGMVFGDNRGCVDIRLRRGETHVEYMLHRFHHHGTTCPAASNIAAQLDWVTAHYRHPLLIFVAGRHDVMWAMVSDMPAVGSSEDERHGYDVGDGAFVLSGATIGTRVVDAYRRAEAQRRERLSEFMTTHRVPHGFIRGSADLRSQLIAMTGVYGRAG